MPKFAENYSHESLMYSFILFIFSFYSKLWFCIKLNRTGNLKKTVIKKT